MKFSTSRQVWPIEAFSLLLMVIFTTELAVMEVFAPLLGSLTVMEAALVDASLLVVIASVPLWAIFAPLFSGHRRRDRVVHKALLNAFVVLIGGFFLIELLVMLVLPNLLNDVASTHLGLVDATLTALLTAPLLWQLLTRLERINHGVAIANLLDSPLLLYLLLLYLVFLSGLLLALILPDDFHTMAFHAPSHALDALLLTLLIAPFLWLFVARPLRLSVQSERMRARMVYEQVIDAVVLIDAHTRITAVNPAALKIFGYSESELVDRPIALLFADNGGALTSMLPTATVACADNSAISLEMTGVHQHGRTLVLDVSISRIELDRRQEFMLIMRDISARKETERALRESDLRFRDAYEQSEDAILFCKPGSSYIVDTNATIERLFGYDRTEIQGYGLERLFPARELARVRDIIGTLRPGATVQVEQLTGRCRDGTEIILSLRAKVMNLRGVELICCTLHDISERIRMEKEAREIQAKLIQTNKMTSLGLLVSGVAHEINNPNNYIMSNVQLLSASWDDACRILREYYREHGEYFLGGLPFSEFDKQSSQLLEGIIDGSQRINRIIDTLKQVSRPQRDELAGVVDMNQVATSAVLILQHELYRYTDNFRCELTDDLPRVIGNSQQLGQVVINLLMNACQALPTRSHGVRLTTGFDPEAAMVTVMVQDEGCGIAAEDDRQIMEPFFTTKLDSGGTGLGLTICRSIVTEHRGSLNFVSTPGQGTTFTVKLPTAAAVTQDATA